MSFGLNNLFAFLNGSSTFKILSTPLKDNILSGSTALVSPTTPIIQKVAPWERLTPNPWLINSFFTAITSFWLHLGFITITISTVPPYFI